MRHPVSSRRSSIKWNMSSEGGKVIVHSESYSGRTIHQNRYLILDLGREVGKLCASDLSFAFGNPPILVSEEPDRPRANKKSSYGIYL